MSKLVVVEMVTLDNVMQSPGGPDEDRSGGFEHGGWAVPYSDEVMGEAMGEGMAADNALLLGRKTYGHFFEHWPKQEGPITDVLNRKQKYVASRTLSEPLPWENSTLLEGDARDAVSKLKQELDKDLVVLGSGALVQSLMDRGLVDELLLTIHPLVLGSGRRLFAEGKVPTELKLVDSKPTTTGVLIATYQTA